MTATRRPMQGREERSIDVSDLVARLKAQAVMTGVSTATLTGVLLLMYSLNQPFTGPVTVTQRPFLHAVQQFHAIDLGS